MEQNVTLTPKEMAARMNSRILDLKAWRFRRCRDRRLRAIAEEWKKNGGYIIATPQELEEEYPEFFHCAKNEDTRVFMWGISAGLRQPGGYYKPEICPITHLGK